MQLRFSAGAHSVGLAMAVSLLSVAGCGGDGAADSGTDPDPGPSSTTVSGVLVRPLSNTAAAQHIVATRESPAALSESPASAACPAVPDGYDPLAAVAVEFKDAAGATVATLTTDACGSFSGSVPSGAVTASAAPAGTAPIAQPISAFTGASPAVVSALPAGATLVISVLQDLGGGKVALTVTDSATGKAVLGLGLPHFSFSTGAFPQSPTSISYGASTAQAASVGIVLDASGSMTAQVGATGKQAIQIASYATHALLDGLGGGNEAGIVIFESDIHTMNDATLASNRFRWLDTSGAARAAYAFSASGLTTRMPQLRPIADLYNARSSIYGFNTSASADPAHPETSVRLGSLYPFLGSTAFYSATMKGLELLDAAANARKIIVAMTDGRDNASRHSADDVIAAANADGVPLYLVAFGSASAVDEPTMQRMAQATGGEYKRVEGLDLTGLFQSIQIGIRFQYVATFAAPLPAGTALSTTVTTAGMTATRTLAIR